MAKKGFVPWNTGKWSMNYDCCTKLDNLEVYCEEHHLRNGLHRGGD